MHIMCVCSALAAEKQAVQQLQGRKGRGVTHAELERQLEQQRRSAEADKAASLHSLKDLFQRCFCTPYKTSEHFCFSMGLSGIQSAERSLRQALLLRVQRGMFLTRRVSAQQAGGAGQQSA